MLVGTAHVSASDAAKVRGVIVALQPDAVVLEMDAARLPRLNLTLADLGNLAVIPPPPAPRKDENGFVFWDPRGWAAAAAAPLIRIMMTKMYDGMSARGMRAGGEFAAAIEECRKQQARLVLADLDSTATIEGFLRSAASTNPFGVMSRYSEVMQDEIGKMGFKMEDEITPDMVDSLKAAVVGNPRVMERLKEEVPEFYIPFIGDRDAALAAAIHAEDERGSRKIVAVVGLGHAAGIRAALTELCWTEPEPA